MEAEQSTVSNETCNVCNSSRWPSVTFHYRTAIVDRVKAGETETHRGFTSTQYETPIAVFHSELKSHSINLCERCQKRCVSDEMLWVIGGLAGFVPASVFYWTTSQVDVQMLMLGGLVGGLIFAALADFCFWILTTIPFTARRILKLITVYQTENTQVKLLNYVVKKIHYDNGYCYNSSLYSTANQPRFFVYYTRSQWAEALKFGC